MQRRGNWPVRCPAATADFRHADANDKFPEVRNQRRGFRASAGIILAWQFRIGSLLWAPHLSPEESSQSRRRGRPELRSIPGSALAAHVGAFRRESRSGLEWRVARRQFISLSSGSESDRHEGRIQRGENSAPLRVQPRETQAFWAWRRRNVGTSRSSACTS